MDNTMDRTESKGQFQRMSVSSLDHCPMDRVDLKLKVGAITSTFPWVVLGRIEQQYMELKGLETIGIVHCPVINRAGNFQNYPGCMRYG